MISFVLPTYNRIAWVGECIQSLLDQTEKDIEIVIVDDGSTDGTREFLKDWLGLNPRVKLVFNKVNMGAGNSRNIGAQEASGDIIAICDSDDVYPEDRAQKILQWFKENPESELVNFPYIRIGYFGEHLENFWGTEFDHEAFKKDGSVTYFSNPTVAMKKKSAQEMGGYPKETKEKTDDVQFVENWVKSGKKIDFDNRAFGCLHRVLPGSMMAGQRGWSPKWVGA